MLWTSKTARYAGGLLSLAAVSIVAAGTASAGIITKDGIHIPDGATFKTSTIWETSVANVGDELRGVGIIESIADINGVNTWQDGDNGRELTFVFSGYTVSSIDNNTDTARVLFTGGEATFYSDPNQNRDVSGSEATAFTTFGDGDEWLNLVGAGGIVQGSPNITLAADLDITAGDLAIINNGTGNGFLDVAMGIGSANENFDTNTLPSGQDISLNSSFNSLNASPAFPIRGSANFRSFAEVQIPVPGTLAMLGLGFMLVAGFARATGRYEN